MGPPCTPMGQPIGHKVPSPSPLLSCAYWSVTASMIRRQSGLGGPGVGRLYVIIDPRQTGGTWAPSRSSGRKWRRPFQNRESVDAWILRCFCRQIDEWTRCRCVCVCCSRVVRRCTRRTGRRALAARTCRTLSTSRRRRPRRRRTTITTPAWEHRAHRITSTTGWCTARRAPARRPITTTSVTATASTCTHLPVSVATASIGFSLPPPRVLLYRRVTGVFGLLSLLELFWLLAPRRLCFLSLFVCLLEILTKTSKRICSEIFREGWQWANEQMITFWWWSR